MPQMANLTIVGPGATNHTFKPRDLTTGVATFVESTGVPLEDKVLKVTPTRTPSGAVKVVIKLALPIVQDMVVAGVTRPTVVRTCYGTITLTADSASTTVERLEMIEMLSSASGNSDIIKCFKDLEFLM